MEVINLCDQRSLVSDLMRQLRDVNLQGDRQHFRTHVRRLGQIMAYEISKHLNYSDVVVDTPLAPAHTQALDDGLVVASILRAGLALHEGLLCYFDRAESAFVSAYRQYRSGTDEFDVHVEYMACPELTGKTLVIADPMLATGRSMELTYRALCAHGTPAHTHVAAVIATDQAVEHVRRHLPPESTTLWTCDLDHVLNAHSYIVPGLGDAGDLLYGEKL